MIVSCEAQAQNGMTSSPWSMFGIGEPETNSYGQNAAMGGVAFGMRSNTLINVENPAGLTALAEQRLAAELSAFVKGELYRSGAGANKVLTGNFSGFAMGGRIMPRWYMAASVSPYSSVGYYFQSPQPIEGDPHASLSSTFTGDGGISKASLSNAFLLSRHLSLGLNLSYYWGNIEQTEQQGGMAVKRGMRVRSFRADLGIQYHRSVNRRLSYVVGAVYGYKQKLGIESDRSLSTGSSTSIEKQKAPKHSLPQYIGIGASLRYRRWEYALDWVYQQYSSLSSTDSRIAFRDVSKFNVGVCYFPGGLYGDKFWERVSYKAGVNLGNSYMRINDNPGRVMRFNAGVGLPIYSGRIDVGVFYDRTQFRKGVLNRNTIGATLTLSFGEMFYRPKYE